MNSPVSPRGPTDEGKYRADIDGLRAVAVLSVLGFHAGLAGFRGGFIGVDVFFVISGYLISGIIFSSLDRGTFTFREFYVRRVNRIFPALIAKPGCLTVHLSHALPTQRQLWAEGESQRKTRQSCK